MFTTPKKRPATETLFGSPNKTIRSKKGLFKDGIWKCNCDDRLPAPKFQVKKIGTNRGRWFYTCQKPKDEGCGLFLWDDDAKTREKHTLINNVRSEPEEGKHEARRSISPTPVARSKPARLESFVTKARVIEISDEEGTSDEFGDWPLSMQEEEEAVLIVDRVGLETPKKASKVDDGCTTPGSKRKRDEDVLPTPSTRNSDGAVGDRFVTPTTNRLKGGMWDGNEHFGIRTPSVTPTPDRLRATPSNLAPAPIATPIFDTPLQHSSEAITLTTSILPLLTPHVPQNTLNEIKDQLSKHELKLSGITRGRDISRQALKAKDREIAELKQSIVGLEAEREMDRVVLRRLRTDVKDSVERKRAGVVARGKG